MTTPSSPYPRVVFLIDTFTDWLKHRRELNEMRATSASGGEHVPAGDQSS